MRCIQLLGVWGKPQRTQAMCQNESRHTVRRVSNGVGNRLALGPRSRYQKLKHDLDPSAWYKATDGFGPSRTDAQADQALCFPVLCGDTCMRVWSSKHRGLSARRAALPWNLAFWLSITTATRPARYSSVELFGPLFRIPHPFAGSWNPSPGTN